jgi:hypothetical protein
MSIANLFSANTYDLFANSITANSQNINTINASIGNITTLNTTTGNITTVNSTTGNIGSILLATVGGTATALNYYEMYSDSVSFSGPWAAPQIAALRITRVGNIVHVKIDPSAAAFSAGMVATSTAAIIPARFRPAANVLVLQNIVENGNPVVGVVSMSSAGTIVIGNLGVAGAATFPFAFAAAVYVAGSVGWNEINFSYQV